ncbi:MAG: hypothetical protein JWN57_402 [Frankiales bacterium]|jgi:hypothetical protein|nr:hypothetical protein [Frankiales bacterium]
MLEERNVRRGAGYVLVGLGAFLLALAVLLPTAVLPRVERVPADEYGRSLLTGRGTFLNPETFTIVPDAAVTVTRIARGDVARSSDDNGVMDISQTVEVEGLTPPLNVVQEKVAYDPTSGIGNGGRGDRPNHRDTLTFKFPFGVQKGTYQYFDTTAGSAHPVTFVRQTRTQGLDVYEFRGTVEPVVTRELGVPGALVGAPGADSVFVEETYSNEERVVLVEPRTGIIVSSTSHPKRTFRPTEGLGEVTGTETTIFQAEVTVEDGSSKQLAADARDAKDQLDLVGRTLPVVAGLAGLLSLLAGLALLVRARRPRHDYRDDTAVVETAAPETGGSVRS